MNRLTKNNNRVKAIESISDMDLQWLAGYLEGEGYFGFRNNNRTAMIEIAVLSTDLDIIEKVASLTGAVIYSIKPRIDRKPCWSARLNTRPAVILMNRLLPFMGKRRREIMTNALNQWHSRKNLVKEFKYKELSLDEFFK